MTPSELLGFGGAGLAGYAYLPQIKHLVRERCSAGLSERAFALWLTSSLLMTIHAVTIGSAVFIILGIQHIASTGVIAFFCRRYRNLACPSHSPAPEHPELRQARATPAEVGHTAGASLR